ncbi:MAG TPA: potassium transporter TrkG, partial [Woeseiaceae bacterium]|nr:potassium transporter TrkG [Woeseiaceae bacterium]
MFAALPKILGLSFFVVGASLLPPAVVSVLYADGHLHRYLAMAVIALLLGAAAMFLGRADTRPMRTREGFMIVTLAWFATSALGAVPFVVIGQLDPAAALFESASGFTTTGSTAIADLTKYPLSLLFFRQEIQWLGGIGVVVAAIALLPMLGIGGMQLMKAETTGPAKSDKLRPRIKHTAQALWRIYLLLTVSCALGYWFAGMSVFDAIAHSLTTVSTGGFSVYNDSLGHFQSPAIEAVAVIFMLLGAINFTVHYRAWADRSWSMYLSNSEVRVFILTVAVVVACVAYVLSNEADIDAAAAVRLSVFEVVSVITSTGFGIDDFSVWPTLLPVFLIFTSFIGGCAGSTAGGMKVIRFLVLTRQAVIEVLRLIHPRLVRPLKL